MIEIATAARLHFGLLNPGPAGPGGRRFGGAGMMVERPGVLLRAVAAPDVSAGGPLAVRALAFARRFTRAVPAPPQHLIVERAPPAHAGLGSGTQLGMAVARALALAAGRPDLPAGELARLVGRGLRSGLGVHGFERGGFLVDAGQRAEAARGQRTADSGQRTEDGGQRTEDRSQRTEDGGQQDEGGPSLLSSVLCPLSSGLAALVARADVPEAWRVVL